MDRKTYAIECQTILRNSDQLELFGVMMELYKGADQEQTIKNINVVFMKNYKKYVPAGFETLKNEY